MSEQKGLEAYAEIRFLAPEECRFEESPGGLLVLHVDGERYESVAVHRAFPFTYGDDYLSVRDKEGNEIGMIRKVSEFDKAARRLIRDELERRYFVPTILRIDRIKEEFGYAYWDVVTDRGPRRFTIRGVQESVLPVGSDRLLIIDVDGNRYEIPQVSKLDAKSFKLVDGLM